MSTIPRIRPLPTILLFLILLIIGLSGVLKILGYEFTIDATALAQKIVEEKRDPQDCYKLLTFDLGPRPSVLSLRRLCVYETAKLLKDPTVCEPLMPNEYGFSCISNIVIEKIQNLLTDYPCRTDQNDFDYFFCNLPQQEEKRMNYNSCEGIVEQQWKAWCLYGQTMQKEKPEDCANLSDINLQAACFYFLDETCEKNIDTVLRSACEVKRKNLPAR